VRPFSKENEVPKLTADQAFELSKAFRSIAIAIGNFREDNFETLKPAQMKRLEELEFDVLNDSTKFNQLSLSLSLDDLQSTLDRIGDATAKAQRAITNLENVDKVIRIASATITLGAAIVSMNPGAIIGSIGNIVDVLS
jgi:hypothetical protein